MHTGQEDLTHFIHAPASCVTPPGPIPCPGPRSHLLVLADISTWILPNHPRSSRPCNPASSGSSVVLVPSPLCFQILLFLLHMDLWLFSAFPSTTPAGLGPGTPSRSQGKNFLAGFCPCTHAHGLGEPSSLPPTHLSAQVLNPQTCFACDFTRVRSGLTTFTHLPVRWWGPSFLALGHKDLC